jgi:hypothetical protein
MPRTRWEHTLGTWGTLKMTVTPEVTKDLPHLEYARAKLVATETEANQLIMERDYHQAQKQEDTGTCLAPRRSDRIARPPRPASHRLILSPRRKPGKRPSGEALTEPAKRWIGGKTLSLRPTKRWITSQGSQRAFLKVTT